MTEQFVVGATDDFIEKIRESNIFKEYTLQKQNLKKYPDLFEKVCEYREKNFELQSLTQPDELFDKTEAFEREYEKFRENPLVDGFLRAELAFCRMMQEINERIMSKLDFE